MLNMANKALRDLALACPSGHVWLTFLPSHRGSVTTGFFQFFKGAKLAPALGSPQTRPACLQFLPVLFLTFGSSRTIQSQCAHPILS